MGSLPASGVIDKPQGKLLLLSASLPSGKYQIILLGDRGTCVNNLSRVVTVGSQTVTSRS